MKLDRTRAVHAWCLGLMALAQAAFGEDPRLRTTPFDPERVYRVRGYVGYQVDLEFEPGERFLGVGAGDIDAIGYAAQDNHLFLKPRATQIHTNLTILTTRRTYHIEYRVLSAAGPERDGSDLIFSLRFIYPPAGPAVEGDHHENATDHTLDQAPPASRNLDYWYCGSPELRPLSAYDDGVGTHLRFNPRGELPAMFVRNDDGSESLLNFNVHDGEIIVHRVAHRLLVRRGRLQGCIVNRSFGGVGSELSTGTVSPAVERATRGPADGQ